MDAVAKAITDLAAAVAQQTTVLARIEARMEADGDVHRGWQAVADEMHAFRDEIRTAQARSARAMVTAKKNADRSQAVAEDFQATQREAVAAHRRQQLGLEPVGG